MITITKTDEYIGFLKTIEATDDPAALAAFVDWLREQGNPSADTLEQRLFRVQGRGRSRGLAAIVPAPEDFVRATWQDRHDRVTHPEGEFDRARRWYPSDRESCGGSGTQARGPSAAWPYSYMLRCRSREHVRALVAAGLRGDSIPPDVVCTVGRWRAWVIRRFFDTLQNLGRRATPEPVPAAV